MPRYVFRLKYCIDICLIWVCDQIVKESLCAPIEEVVSEIERELLKLR